MIAIEEALLSFLIRLVVTVHHYDIHSIYNVSIQYCIARMPERIYFGCLGGEGGNGNFGSVDADEQNLVQVMKGAYTESVLFLPHELEGIIRAKPGVSQTNLFRRCGCNGHHYLAQLQYLFVAIIECNHGGSIGVFCGIQETTTIAAFVFAVEWVYIQRH